jgi:3-dehydroquinate dehydratase-2
MARILLINGPNLNLLGLREPERYGRVSLTQIEEEMTELASARGHEMLCFQSNHEGLLIDRIHSARTDSTSWIIINPGGLTHTSVSLRDALIACAVPFIEMHISNVHAREDFRRHSYLSDVAAGIIVGLGTHGYRLALEAAMVAIEEH